MERQMKKTVKGLSLLLCLLLMVGIFAGCGGTGSSSGSETEQPSSSQSASNAEGNASSAVESASGEVGSSVASAAVKTITFQVVHKDGSTKEFTIATEEENLRGALEQENLIQGEESEYGLFVKTVDGETVDDGNQEWWCLTKGGEMWNNGVDSTILADGDAYEFTFTVGY